MPVISTAVYQEIQNFYARQMRLLDGGDTVAWSETFEPDGVFDANGLPEPVRGRGTIESAARKAWEQLTGEGIQRRHWIGMVEVDERADGSLLARSYALVILTKRDGMPTVQASTTCEDVLVRDGEALQVRYRTVRRDDRPDTREA